MNAKKHGEHPADAADCKERQTSEGGGKAPLVSATAINVSCAANDDADHHPDDTVPQSEAKEHGKKDHEAGGP